MVTCDPELMESEGKSVAQICKKLGVSERRARQILDQPRSTQRYFPKENVGEREIGKSMHAITKRHPRYGTPRVTRLLRDALHGHDAAGLRLRPLGSWRCCLD